MAKIDISSIEGYSEMTAEENLKTEAERNADSGTGALPQMQQETDGSERARTDQVSKVQSTG